MEYLQQLLAQFVFLQSRFHSHIIIDSTKNTPSSLFEMFVWWIHVALDKIDKYR